MMAAKKAYAPSMSDRAVKARTGKDWAGWFGTLDRAGAAKLDHRAIAALLSKKYGVPGWWTQMVTVEYERARGKRAVHQTASGYSVSISKTIAADIPEVYAAVADAGARRKWFPKGAFAATSQTANKYLRGAWKKDARVEIGFMKKGEGKAQIGVGVTKLASKADVERERTAWKAALAKLQSSLEP
jgi:hypothetical protein